VAAGGRARRALWLAGWPVRFAMLSLVRLYRLTLGQVVGGGCRFYPSCSAYAEQAIGELGVLRGLSLTVWRVLRCSPLSKGGVDYPPRAAMYDDDIHRHQEEPARAERIPA
jgi:putative membrane protein insertion efficiency factor